MNKRTRVLIGILLTGAVLTLVGRWALGFRTLTVGDSQEAPRIEDYADALSWADSEGVDYSQLSAHGETKLRRYVEALAHHGPTTTPDAYPSKAERLSYYLNAYNALVLFAVLEHLPITSVQDVHGLIEPKAGFGFFYALSFHLDGERINLYDLENDIIRGFGDARIHAAINCASESCPTLRSEPFNATQLETELDEVFAAFCTSNKHVSLGEQSVEVSAIFDWFGEDFTDDESALRDVIASCSTPTIQKALRDRKLPLSFKNYDWNLNQKP